MRVGSKHSVALVALWLSASGAFAEDRMSPQAFEALAEGRTLHFTLGGVPFGAEQFFPGRRSLWRFESGACVAGRWYGDGAAICFVYEGEGMPICWHFTTENGGGHRARLIEGDSETGFMLDLAGIDDAPLDCPGPQVGS